ncbi:hypothetical protein G7046_g9412 [Stylonectria norvegica]|nr:hypothetical protein G7046_g9412 [Stylonectria norvegica]
MILDGEKYACEACVRGHRVSNCQHSAPTAGFMPSRTGLEQPRALACAVLRRASHLVCASLNAWAVANRWLLLTDRPLQHINKKGRPVSQCTHCRSMRKSRSAHIKCDCGEKTSKCAHLQPTVDGHQGELPVSRPREPKTCTVLTRLLDTETCCCNHGGRCTCCHKKEPTLDTVPESDSEGESVESVGSLSASTVGRAKSTARRRRANTVHSDGALTFDQNGHHKPAQKHNRVSQKCGPYQLNRVNSAHSASSLGTGTDNLLQKTADGRAPGGRSRAATNREPRRVKSETASPLMSGHTGFQNLNGNLPPLDLSGIDYPPYIAGSTFDLFGSGFNSETEGPMYSAGLSSTSVDWSHYDLADKQGDSFTPSSYSQAGAQSFNGLFDFGSGSEQLPNLANTTSTSGEVSEVEDFMPGGDNDFDGFPTSSAFLRQGNGMMPSAADLSRIDYDSFYKGADTGPIAGHGLSMVEDDPAFWMPNYNEGLATMDESPDPLGPSASLANMWEV